MLDFLGSQGRRDLKAYTHKNEHASVNVLPHVRKPSNLQLSVDGQKYIPFIKVIRNVLM